MSASGSIKKIIRIIDECLLVQGYVRAFCDLFGIWPERTPAQFELIATLLERKTYYEGAFRTAKKLKKKIILPDGRHVINEFTKILHQLKQDKNRWKNEAVKVLCSDEVLIEMAEEYRQKQSFVRFKKEEIEKYFDFSIAVPFWNQIPDYTLIMLGGGLSVSSPEYDLFNSMCWLHDEAVKTHKEFLERKKRIDDKSFDLDSFLRLHTIHGHLCVQTTISAFLVLEAHLNGLSHLYLKKSPSDLTEEQRLYLNEKIKDKNGKVRRKFVPIQEKLHRWIEILSPHNQTFDKGGRLFQDFMQLKAYRDSIVHFSETKMDDYFSIDFETAKHSVRTVIAIVEKIDEMTAPSSAHAHKTWWLKDLEDDGLFNLPAKFRIEADSPS